MNCETNVNPRNYKDDPSNCARTRRRRLFRRSLSLAEKLLVAGQNAAGSVGQHPRSHRALSEAGTSESKFAKIYIMSVQEIERAITQLPLGELTELMKWLENHHHEKWDQQIEADLDSGRLDNLINQAETEYEAGKARAL